MIRVLFTLFAAGLVWGCSYPDIPPRYRPGEIVQSVLTGQRGQIIMYFPKLGLYNVRFQAAGGVCTANDGFLGVERIEQTPLIVVEYMSEYELKPVRDDVNGYSNADAYMCLQRM